MSPEGKLSILAKISQKIWDMQSNLEPQIANIDEKLFIVFYSRVMNNQFHSPITNIRVKILKIRKISFFLLIGPP